MAVDNLSDIHQWSHRFLDHLLVMKTRQTTRSRKHAVLKSQDTLRIACTGCCKDDLVRTAARSMGEDNVASMSRLLGTVSSKNISPASRLALGNEARIRFPSEMCETTERNGVRSAVCPELPFQTDTTFGVQVARNAARRSLVARSSASTSPSRNGFCSASSDFDHQSPNKRFRRGVIVYRAEEVLEESNLGIRASYGRKSRKPRPRFHRIPELLRADTEAMQRFVSGEAGLCGLEESFDDGGEVLEEACRPNRRFPSPWWWGFDFLDQRLDLASQESAMIPGRSQQSALDFSTLWLDLLPRVGLDITTVRESLKPSRPITSVIGGKADSPQPIPQQLQPRVSSISLEKTLTVQRTRRTEIRSWWTASTSSVAFLGSERKSLANGFEAGIENSTCHLATG